MGLFNILFNLGVNKAPFDKTMGEAVTTAGAAARQMSTHFGQGGPIGHAISQLKSHLASMFGIGALSAAIHKTAEYASKIEDLSDATGASKQKLQELDYAFRQHGATIEDGEKALKMLALARREALQNPTGEKAAAFDKMGISQEALRATEDPAELLMMLSDAVKGAEMDLNTLPVVLDLIGKKNSDVIPAMIAGLRELGAEGRQAFQFISD